MRAHTHTPSQLEQACQLFLFSQSTDYKAVIIRKFLASSWSFLLLCCVCAQSWAYSPWRSPPGSTVHGIFQARILERVLERAAISWGFRSSSAGKESTCNAGDPSLIPESGRSPGEGIGYPLQYSWPYLVAWLVKNPPAMWETWVRPLGWEDPLEKRTATHSSILAGRMVAKSQTWLSDFHFAISCSRGFSHPRLPVSPAFAGRFFYHWATWEALKFLSWCLKGIFILESIVWKICYLGILFFPHHLQPVG